MRNIVATFVACLAIISTGPASAEVKSGVETGTGSTQVEACTYAEKSAHAQLNSPTLTIPYSVSESKVEPCECGQVSSTEWSCSVEWGATVTKKN